ncbi:TPA: hypothetical protein HA265_06270 [Candidatus Woesearchaeota archaeon]|nr:hypothetical protein [Candidatus Woesearchaeota archaeon]
MTFMEKNVNIFLLVLMLVIAGALAGSAVYYQHSFGELTGQQEDTSTDLAECRTDLESYKFNLNKTLRSLNTTTQDIRRYDELYSTKTEELETTQSTLQSTESTLKATQIDLQEETSLKNKYKKDYEDQLSQNRDLEEQNAILAAQKRQLETENINLKSKIATSEECIIDFIDDYTGTLTQAMVDEVDDCKP